MTALQGSGDHVGITGINDVEDLERLDAQLQRVAAVVVARLPDRAGTEASSRSIGHRVVKRRAHDGDIRLANLQRLG